jgi:4-diphosphocytidyl-2-C-methyl-D-erythritol kinase
LRAHAKLNLFLAIGGLRADGFHDLTSVFHAIDLADDVVLRPGDAITMRMEVPGEVGAGVNLATRSLDELGIDGLAVDITKRIPMAAGLGGGSSDAGAVLVGAREARELTLSDEELIVTGARVGSDVPFFVAGGGTALVEGRGERVTPIETRFHGWFVIGITFTPLSTADVYARWDELGDRSRAPSVEPFLDALSTGDLADVGALLHNDLEAATFDMLPELAHKKEALLEAGALGAQAAGSGPTLFALAAGPEHAQSIAEAVGGLFDRVHVVASSPRSVERVR